MRVKVHRLIAPACDRASQGYFSTAGVKIPAVPIIDSIDNSNLAKESAVTVEAIGLSHGRSGGN
ncbi:MAG: hypothetical protein AB4352_11275 [Hormoscilla sp.]